MSGKKKMQKLQYNDSTLKSIISYTYPKVYKGKETYIGFYAFDPSAGKMRRKRIKVNFVKTNRKKYVDELMKRIISQLDAGWNPWIEQDNPNAYHLWSDVSERYKSFIFKMAQDGVYRPDTYRCYLNFIRNLDKYNDSLKSPITYIYQLNRNYLTNFIDSMYIDRDNSAQTRNNYLVFVRLFGSWLVNNRYCNSNPADGIAMISKRLIKKRRTIIDDKDILRLNEYLIQTGNKHYLLACYILYYCFIRPKEMSKLQLKHFSIAQQTVFIPSENAKNRKDAIVTLPAKVIHLMLEIKVFDNPSESYLFSKDFKPGASERSEKAFRDFWSRKIKIPLSFPAAYKFYSLKDTGITSMLRQYDSITVRDQARHADILMTDSYTPHDIQRANSLIKNHDGIF